MKKMFVEPEMHRIELNLKENIAASSGTGEDEGEHTYIKVMIDNLYTCTVLNTGMTILGGLTIEQLQACTVTERTRSIGALVPIEDVLPYIR